MQNRIVVYTGPMFSGKTAALLGAYERATIAHKKVLAFKPKIDNRFGNNVIKSRKFGEVQAISISKIEDILKYDADIYFIDEFQFLEGDVNALLELVDNKGKTIYASGLDLTAERKPFGHMPELFSIADSVVKFTAVCHDCDEDKAIYSYYLGKKDTDIVVGNTEYIPLCRSCMRKRLMADKAHEEKFNDR